MLIEGPDSWKVIEIEKKIITNQLSDYVTSSAGIAGQTLNMYCNSRLIISYQKVVNLSDIIVKTVPTKLKTYPHSLLNNFKFISIIL